MTKNFTSTVAKKLRALQDEKFKLFVLRKQVDSDIAAVDLQLLKMFQDYDIVKDELEYGVFYLRKEQPTLSLDKELLKRLLVENGMDADQVGKLFEQATKVGKPKKAGVTFRPAKEEGGLMGE